MANRFSSLVQTSKKNLFSLKSSTTSQSSTTSTPATTGRFSSMIGAGGLKLQIQKKADLSTVEGLSQLATESGLGKQIEPIVTQTEPKLSLFQRLVKGLGAFNPAEALLVADKKGLVGGLKEYAKGALSDIGSALTGTNNDYERRSFKDIAEKAGVHNAILKYGIGFLGDVFLDPSTYFGGALLKTIGSAPFKVAGLGLRGLEKVAPEVTGIAKAAVKTVTEPLKEAFGRAFIPAFKTQEGYDIAVMKIVNKLETKKQEVLLKNFELMGTNTLTKAQQKELVSKMIAGKVAEFEARQAGKSVITAGRAGMEKSLSVDPAIQKVMNARNIQSQEIAKLGGIKDPFQHYFPFLKKETVPNFLSSAQKLKVGSEGWKKQFKNILQEKDLVLDPVEAFSRRDWEVIKDIAVKEDLHSLVNGFGKQASAFKSVDEALSAGYVPVFEKGIGIKPKAYFQAMGAGKIKVKNPLGYLPEAEAKFLSDMITPEFTSIDMLAKATGFDAYTALFKRSVTGLFPSFHVRNFVSGVMQNFEVLGVDAIKPGAIAAGVRMAKKVSSGAKFSDETVQIAGKVLTEKQIMQPFVDLFGSSKTYVRDFEDATREFPLILAKPLSTESLKSTVKTLGIGEKALPMRAARAVGQFIETQQKATAYLTALGQGRTIDEALRLATRSGFDYRMVTKFESKVLRKIIPFYSFTRKNIELQLRTLKETPQRINQIVKAIQNAGGASGLTTPTEEEKPFLPDYIKSGYMLKIKNTAGAISKYVSSFGSPIEAFTDLFNGNTILNLISRTNPLIKAPIEIGIGKDSFRERDLQTVYDAKEYARAPQFIKDLLDIKPVEKPTWEKNANGESVVTGTRTQYVADPVKLSIARSFFTSRGFTFFDSVFDKDTTMIPKVIKLFTGVKLQDVDIEFQKYLQDKEKREMLTDILERYNAVKTFETTYIPKTQQ